jgi:phosphoglycolate phosphatase-like HAD superfamily hydrolase
MQTSFVVPNSISQPHPHSPSSCTPFASNEMNPKLTQHNRMASQVPQPGLKKLMSYLDSRGIRKGICTRNFDAPVQHLLSTFVADSVFHPIVTRDFRPPKPDPAGILHIARTWGLLRPKDDARRDVPAVRDGEADEKGTGSVVAAASRKERHGEEIVAVGDASALIMVGDSIDDMTAGRRAGAATVLLVNDVNRHLAKHTHTDLVISRLDDLIAVLEDGF